MAIDIPDHSAPVNAPAAPEHAQEKEEIREASRGDVKRGPHYLIIAATLKAKRHPVKQMMNRVACLRE